MLSDPSLWVITPDEKSKFEIQFRDLSPINGYVSGNHAKNLFMKSNLPTAILGKIWSLADYDNDGKMTLNEFCIAMHLIKRKLEGVEVPDMLPLTLNTAGSTNKFTAFQPVSNFNTMPAPPIINPIQSNVYGPGSRSTMVNQSTVSTSNGYQQGFSSTGSIPITTTTAPTAIVNPISVTQTDSDEWSMSQVVRPRYRLQFNQQDRNKRGYLTGVEAKAILIQSGLPHGILGQIWSLADIDQDGNLTCDEFCIAMHLVEQARAGKVLPNQLPPSLLPAAFQRKPVASQGTLNTGIAATNGSSNIGLSKQEEAQKSVVLTGEDERRANYLKGQAELQKRRAILEEQMRQEEEARRAKEQAEIERQEKIRREKEEARLEEIKRHMQLKLEQEEAMRLAAEQREKSRLEAEKYRLMEMEKRRLEVANTERRQERESLSEMNSRKGDLMEAIANENEKKRDLQQRIELTSGTVETYKASIGSMRDRRDKLMHSTDGLREELDVAKAELTRCQREKRDLEMQLMTMSSGGGGGKEEICDPVAEQIKTIQALKFSHKDKIKQLDKEIKELELSMGKRSQSVTNSKSKVKDLERKVTSRLVADIRRLQNSVSEKKNAAFAAMKGKSGSKGSNVMGGKESRSQSFDAEFMHQGQYNNGDRISAFMKIPSSSSMPRDSSSALNREYIYYEAMYPFEGRQSDELSFQTGDCIVIDTHDQIEPNSGWLYGWIDNTTSCGLFPEVYVKLIRREQYIQSSRSSIVSNNENFGFINSSSQGFNTTPSNKISGTNNDTSNGNITAQVPYRNMTLPGIGPNDQQLVAADDTTPCHSVKLCVALYPYEANVLGDLNLQPGDIIEILEQKVDWWKGYNRNNQQRGLLPSNYVKYVDSEESAKLLSADVLTRGSAGMDENNDINNADMYSSHHSQMSINSLASSTYNTIEDYDQQSNTMVADKESGASTPEIAEVKNEFNATSAEQLSLQVGQLVVVRDKSDTGWWKGEIQQRGQQRRLGWFPGQYVKVISSTQSIQSEFLNPENRNANCTTPTPMMPSTEEVDSNTLEQQSDQQLQVYNTSVINLDESLPGDNLITMFNYSAQNIDELTFEKGSVLVLMDKNEPEWWLGRNLLTGQEGLFPVNYVRRMQQDNPTDEDVMRSVLQQIGGTLSSGGTHTVSGRPVSWYIDGTMTFNAILTEDEKRRQFYIRELIETEKVYYEDLQEVHQVFYEPIKRSNMLTAEELKSIFLNWSDLIPNSYNFYMALKIRKDTAGPNQPIQCIGDILLSNFPNFIVYVRFCSMQNQAIAMLQRKQQQNPKFKEMCEQCEGNLRCQKMPMTSYFLKPMQRITKYKLLVENIIKHTDDNHPDRSDIEESVAAARSLCESVNDGVREKENSERLEWMQEHIHFGDGFSDHFLFNSNTNCLGHRKLLYSGTLYKARSNKELVGFLCNDFLLLAIPQYNTGGTPFVFPLEISSKDKMQFKIYKKPIMLNQVMISSGVPTASNITHSRELFTMKDANYDFILKALSPNDRDKWVDRLTGASAFYVNTENCKRERSMSIKRTAGIGRLILTIVEGTNIRLNSTNSYTASRQRKDVNKIDLFCEVCLGNQLHRTKVVSGSANPKWNSQMQFLLKNIEQDVLCLTVYRKDYFAPNDFLGRIEVAVKYIVKEKGNQREPIEKKLKLMEVESGNLLVKLDLALFKRN